MATEVNDLELAKICDTTTSPAEKKRLILEHFRLAHEGTVANILERLNSEASDGMTADQEAKAIEEMGRSGISSMTGRKIFNLFTHEANANLDDPSEIKLRKPGIKILTNESAAEDGAENSAGLNRDGTPNTVNPFVSFADAASEFGNEDKTPDAPKTTAKPPVYTIT